MTTKKKILKGEKHFNYKHLGEDYLYPRKTKPKKKEWSPNDNWKGDSLNVEITSSGYVIKREGYKTLRGFISWLKKTNKRYRKMKFVGDFTFRLPIKP